MASAWQTLEEGALTLGISSRTLHRRIAKNEVQTRLHNGRREVLVEIADPPMPDPSVPAADMTDSLATGRAEVAEPTSDLSEGVGQTMLALSEDRIRRTDLAIMAYQQSVTVAAADARRTRTAARVAWSLTGTMAAGLFLGGLWATHQVTDAQGQVRELSRKVESLSTATDSSAQKADESRREAESARVSAARAEGELAATRAELDNSRAEISANRAKPALNAEPTTKPAKPLLQRLADVFAGDGAARP